MKTKDLFLLGFYAKVPRNPKDSSKKGFGQLDENWSYNESVHFTRGLKDKDLVSANVILNISDRKVIKCSFNRDNTFENLYSYYRDNYPQYVQILEQGMKEKEIQQISQDLSKETNKENNDEKQV